MSNGIDHQDLRELRLAMLKRYDELTERVAFLERQVRLIAEEQFNLGRAWQMEASERARWVK